MTAKKILLIKIAFIVATFAIVSLFVTGIVQTFVLKSYQNKNEIALAEKQAVIDQKTYAESLCEYHQSQEYIDEYNRQQGYGNSGDIEYK